MRFVADSLCLPWFQYSKPAICCLIHLFLTDSFAAGGVMAVVYRNGSWSTKDRTRQRIYDEYFRCLACKRIVVDTWVILSIVWFFNVCCLWFTSLNTSCLFDPFHPPLSPFLSLFHTAWSLGFGALLHSLFINSTSPSETTRRLSRFRPSHKTPDWHWQGSVCCKSQLISIHVDSGVSVHQPTSIKLTTPNIRLGLGMVSERRIHPGRQTS